MQERRFSEFDELDRDLSRTYFRDCAVRLPHFPSKVGSSTLSTAQHPLLIPPTFFIADHVSV